MARLYGDQQRAEVKRIREELIQQLEKIYRHTFDNLSDAGLGEGVLIKLTQLLLLSRDGAISPLQEEIEARHIKNLSQ